MNHMVMLAFRGMSAICRNRHLDRNNGVYRLGAGWLGSSFAEKSMVVLGDHEPAMCLCGKKCKQPLQGYIKNRITLPAG